MKEEADLLKSYVTNGAWTKLIALGVGDHVNIDELNDIASPPTDSNVIRVRGYSELSKVEGQLRNISCSGG